MMEDFDDEALEQSLKESQPELGGFPADLQLVMREGAKIYIKDDQEFATVDGVDQVAVTINLGTKKSPVRSRIPIDDFKRKLLSDEIVAKARLKFRESGDEGGGFTISPRAAAKAVVTEPTPVLTDSVKSDTMVIEVNNLNNPVVIPQPKVELKKAYIDVKSGKFSLDPKPDLIEIEYREVVKQMNLELNSVQIEQLKKLGIIKE